MIVTFSLQHKLGNKRKQFANAVLNQIIQDLERAVLDEIIVKMCVNGQRRKVYVCKKEREWK